MYDAVHTFAVTYPTVAAWFVTVGSALVSALIGFVAYRAVWSVASRVAHGGALAATVLVFAKKPGAAVVVLLVLQMAWEASPSDLPRLAAVEHFTTLALTIALVWVGVRCVEGVAEAIIATHPVSATDNLQARRLHTQTRVLSRTVVALILFVGTSLALMSFPTVRHIGTSLLASAGVAGLVVGLAARPALANLIAGLQIAVTQPIRLDDVVVIDGEWGRIEEIRGTYVILHIWDERRMVIPLQWFLDHSFANWTLTSSEIMGSVFIWMDYRLPLEPLEIELKRLCSVDKAWNGRVCVLQVTDANEKAMQLRALVSSADSSLNWDLRCRVRAGLISFVQEQYPHCLPQTRVEMDQTRSGQTRDAASAAGSASSTGG